MNSLTVHLTNPTSVPQYQLQVYAYAKRDGHYVGAANATVMNLGAGTRRSVRLGLVGEPRQPACTCKPFPRSCNEHREHKHPATEDATMAGDARSAATRRPSVAASAGPLPHMSSATA